jgi:hypothetical protein
MQTLILIALCFFFNTLDGTEELRTTEILSPNICVIPSKSTLSDISIKRISTLSTVAILDATVLTHKWKSAQSSDV